MTRIRMMAVAGVLGTASLLGISGVAGATPSPNGPGQPGTGSGNGSTSCQNFTTTPGGSSSGQSPFNQNGQSGQVYAGNPGTASQQHSNSTHSVSEYDNRPLPADDPLEADPQNRADGTGLSAVRSH